MFPRGNEGTGDRAAEAQQAAMLDRGPEEIRRAVEAVTVDLGRGRLPLVEMGVW